MTENATYLAELERALKRRGVGGRQTADVIGEMSDHLAESGEQPLLAFGDPEQYAAELLAAEEPQDDPHERYETRTFRATALDEVEILADLGRDGWELTGVRDFGLRARRPLQPQARTAWEYVRRSALRRGPVLAEMLAEGWAPSGRWLTFHYFKRPRADVLTGPSPGASS